MVPGVLNDLILFNNLLELKGITVRTLLKFQLVRGGFHSVKGMKRQGV